MFEQILMKNETGEVKSNANLIDKVSTTDWKFRRILTPFVHPLRSVAGFIGMIRP